MKIVFMGTPDFSVPILHTLVDHYEVVAVVTQPDRPVGRKKLMTPPPVKKAAIELGIPTLQPEKIREMNELEKLFSYEPDLIITAAYGQLLPKALLDYPKHGCINVHASLLPQYRGGAPIHQAVIDGESKTGVTIMYMVEKLDAGDMLSQIEVPILENDSVGSVHDKLSLAGRDLLMDTLPQLLEGKIEPEKQDEKKVTFAKNISRDMERIDWSRSGEALYNQIRGLNPWPVAFTTLEQKPLKVWWSEKVVLTKKGEPGEIISIEKDGFIVATGNDVSLKLTEIQPAGKKRMNAESFIRGANLMVGQKLGD
ncbi:methionyl-tRNA formyltransferase [Alkalihalobacillus trypoxylicola]|uniref:Methionyl-tRNA formyltransferase n=1 Tax=Alkalihalobacillus trypoxylicola TaxID=519424 RepID=A0A162FA49_9BACI|nr:methionyl-tRNA formyltransferase [Alkalihalobacillus trypoxylicola]KYG35132.1 methionyl-tRNA formyltransferase [Alkalihalobacillus trypoxylicola]